MLKQDSTPTKETLKICSRCLNHEVDSWMNENWKYLTDKVRQEMYSGLKSVPFKEGNCIVCNNERISDNAAAKALKTLKENKIQEKLIKEFKKFFVC